MVKNMKRLFFRLCLGVLMAGVAAPAWAGQSTAEARCYELRVYTAAPGKLDALLERFRRHTTRLFERHGMTNVGYWLPLDNPENRLFYVVAYPDCEARDPTWDAFHTDPDWQTVHAASQAGGALVTDVQSILMTPADFSPAPGPTFTEAVRTFELRTYTAAPGRLDALLTRFRNHTVALFERHGMTNVGYWLPTSPEQGAGTTLHYVLAYPSREAAQRAWDAFAADPDWQAASEASRVDGPLVLHVESVFMTPTDFSPIK